MRVMLVLPLVIGMHHASEHKGSISEQRLTASFLTRIGTIKNRASVDLQEYRKEYAQLNSQGRIRHPLVYAVLYASDSIWNELLLQFMNRVYDQNAPYKRLYEQHIILDELVRHLYARSDKLFSRIDHQRFISVCGLFYKTLFLKNQGSYSLNDKELACVQELMHTHNFVSDTVIACCMTDATLFGIALIRMGHTMGYVRFSRVKGQYTLSKPVQSKQDRCYHYVKCFSEDLIYHVIFEPKVSLITINLFLRDAGSDEFINKVTHQFRIKTYVEMEHEKKLVSDRGKMECSTHNGSMHDDQASDDEDSRSFCYCS